jgi:ribose transport system permease protein
MSMFEKNDGVGTAAAQAPSEWTLTTPTEGADVGGISALPMDAVAQGGMSPRARAIRRGLNSSPAIMFGALVVIFLVFTALSPSTFPKWGNLHDVISDSSILMVMAVGMTYVMVAAGFDLSIGSVLVFAGVVSSRSMTDLGPHLGFAGGKGGWGVFVLGFVVALVSGAIWGGFTGFCVTRLRVPALITTLGTLGAALGIADLITKGNDVASIPNSLQKVQSQSWLDFPPIFWLAALVVIVGALVLRYTRFGRHTYIVGSNDEAARRAGINVNAHLMKLYTLSGTMAGLAGYMSLIRYSTTTISSHANDSLSVITGVILGGTSLYGGAGTIVGTVIGMFIPAVLQNGFVIKGFQPFWQQVATGFILILAVYIDQLKRRSRDRG